MTIIQFADENGYMLTEMQKNALLRYSEIRGKGKKPYKIAFPDFKGREVAIRVAKEWNDFLIKQG